MGGGADAQRRRRTTGNSSSALDLNEVGYRVDLSRQAQRFHDRAVTVFVITIAKRSDVYE
jgi:hypothetical protein